MEEYLRTVAGGLGADASKAPVHVVLGGPDADVDTVAATLCLAVHLGQKEPSDGVCVPVLWGQTHQAVLPGETARYLLRVKISESSLLWREDVDLEKIHSTRKLSLTLLRDGLLDSSEYRTLASSVLRVVHHDGGRRDAGDDGASSALTTVAREILQEAPEHVGAALRESLGEALRLQGEALWLKHGRQSVELEELRRTWERWSDAAAARQHDQAKLQDLERLMSKEPKEFSDGEMTIALTSVVTDEERWYSYVDGFKSFSHGHGYDALVVLRSTSDSVHHPGQQVAVYSNNTDILNQICCELEESSIWSLSGELDTRDCLQVYHIPLNAPSGTLLLEDEIQGLLKEFVNRRGSMLACHPSSRTSSTEGVAGSVEFSQGSSGINDMDGSDIERTEGGSGDAVAISRVMADGEEDTGVVGVGPSGDLISPDSGMTTIRSSRSSKESSVFLSDDSPVGEVVGGGGSVTGQGGLFLRNPSPLGLSSLSPPVPPERRRHRTSKKSDNFDLFSFDPLHASNHPLPAAGESANSGGKLDDGGRTARSSSLSECEELSMVDFSAANSMGGLESRHSSIDHHGHIHGSEMIDTVVPPTPVNSLVGSRPSSSCGVRFFPEDVVERISGLQHKDSVSSSLSETWEELGFDTQGALPSNESNSWHRTRGFESPQNIEEEVGGEESIGDMAEGENREKILRSGNTNQKGMSLEPQLSLITEQTESPDNWNPDSVLRNQWNPVTLTDLHLTPPEDEVIGKFKAAVNRIKGTSSLASKKTLNTLTPDTSKEDDDGAQGNKESRQLEILDFWAYSAQKGFLKSDSGTTTSYPESLDMWNMTIRDDSLSPLTTPDNLSENSGSFCGLANAAGAASIESPQGFSDGGMAMWNTTIQEDSSSTASPEGPENEKNLHQIGSWDARDTAESYANKQAEEETVVKKKRDVNKVLSQTLEETVCRDNQHNVRIVIEAAEGTSQDTEEKDDGILDAQSQNYQGRNLESEHSKEETLPTQGSGVWDLPIPGMVTSTSEYDNVGASTWSLASSPDTYASPIVDMIQLEEQSSPFVAVTKPEQVDQRNDHYKWAESLIKTEHEVTTDNERPVNQVFLFEGPSELRDKTGAEGGSTENKYDICDQIHHIGDHSPFILVDNSVTDPISTCHYSSQAEASDTQHQIEQSSSSSLLNWDNGLKSEPLSDSLPIRVDHYGDGAATESQGSPYCETNGNVESKTAETMSLSSSSGGERETLKYSPDSLQPGSRDELRSNSDGDSSSGLEMEYIIVSGTVKEAEREWHHRPKEANRQAKGARTSMETFSMLSYAATVLKNQAQALHREHQENTEQNRQNQRCRDIDSNAAEHHMVTETVSGSQTKTDSDALHQSDLRSTACSQTQIEEGNYDDKSNFVPRSVSPSLRYPSDHFLKTREEVYVHSQISMEDSDEGEQSPSETRACSTSLSDFKVWDSQFTRQDTPQSACETQSPALTNSSVSQNSSLVGTPICEPGVSANRGIGLPFSGDLMEEENGEEEQDEEELTSLPKGTSTGQNKTESEQQLGSNDLLSFTEELIGGCSSQQTELQTLEPKRDYYGGHPINTVTCDKWSVEKQIQDLGASEESCSSILRTQQNVTSQLLPQPTNESAASQWTGSQNFTQGPTQYGYNYHHIDQRTETQRAYVDAKFTNQQDSTDVYAEFTTDPGPAQYAAQPPQSYYDPGVTFQYASQSQYEGDVKSMCASEPQCSQYEDSSQVNFESPCEPLYQSDTQPESEDHARYVPEGYVHFLLSREQGDTAAGVMMKTASSEDAEDMENKEDPPSSVDLSVGSNQRRKLAAPPMNVSLDRSEGSLLSEDALDTEDEALDTGDDLDVNIDELDTSDEADSLEFNRHEDSGEGAASSEAAAAESRAAEDGRLWRSVVIGEQEHRIDMKCIEPYKRVISHGGYYAEENAIIVFAACFLPDSDCENYNYVMENLFLYVISTLELMVAEDYMIVYLNGATPRRRMPGFTWMKKCYQMIDRRLKKNLKMFIIVHPSWFIRTLLGITRPFISSKFSSKIKYVNSLQELGEIIPMEYVHIPPSIVKYDEMRRIHKFACMRLDEELQDTAAKADRKGNSVV